MLVGLVLAESAIEADYYREPPRLFFLELRPMDLGSFSVPVGESFFLAPDSSKVSFQGGRPSPPFLLGEAASGSESCDLSSDVACCGFCSFSSPISLVY